MSTSTRNAAARQRRLPIITLSVAFAIGLLDLITPAAAAEMTFIHMGDVHGQMVPRTRGAEGSACVATCEGARIGLPRQEEMSDEKS